LLPWNLVDTERKIREKTTRDMPTNRQPNSATVSVRDYEGIRSEFVDHACSHLSVLNIHSQLYHSLLLAGICHENLNFFIKNDTCAQYIEKNINLWRAKYKRNLTYCCKKVNFKMSFSSTQCDIWQINDVILVLESIRITWWEQDKLPLSSGRTVGHVADKSHLDRPGSNWYKLVELIITISPQNLLVNSPRSCAHEAYQWCHWHYRCWLFFPFQIR